MVENAEIITFVDCTIFINMTNLVFTQLPVAFKKSATVTMATRSAGTLVFRAIVIKFINIMKN